MAIEKTMDNNLDITDFIKRVYTYDSKIDPMESLINQYYANGYPGLFYFKSKGSVQLEYRNNTHSLPRLFIYGQNVYPKKLMFNNDIKLIIILFDPCTLRDLTNQKPKNLIDQYYDISNHVGKFILNEVDSINDINGQADWLCSLILKTSRSTLNVDKNKQLLRSILKNLESYNHSILVEELALHNNINIRKLQRLFQYYIGLSPSNYLRIMQFNQSFDHLHNQKLNSLTEIAYKLKYADQAHFTRSFKKYSDQTPKRYLNNIKSNQTQKL